MTLTQRLKREPVLISGLVAAVIAVLTAFGLDLTQEQVGAIMGLTVALLALLVRRKVTPVD